ncbi:MAG: hypothetical protein QM754_02465 [Tepidisphaeraceae bacterium]
MELEQSTESILPPDKHPHMPEPPVVRLLAIADVRLTAVAGIEPQLDDFYVGLLKFERDETEAERIVYKAERWRLIFTVVEVPPERDDYRPVMVQIPHFGDFVDALKSRPIEFEWQKGVSPGVEAVFLRDPAGFWVSVGPIRTIG